MKTRFIGAALVAGLLALLPAGPVQAETATAEPDSTWTRLGTLRGDTLVVSRDKVIAAALTYNEMLAASGAMRDAAGAQALGAWQGFLPQVRLG